MKQWQTEKRKWWIFVIDANGFRLNVGVVIVNRKAECLWGRRTGQASAWQFPQGGIDQDESEQQAMYRELYEELGLRPADVAILGKTQEWLYYRIPPQFRRAGTNPVCIGQKQKWFLLQLLCEDSRVKLDTCLPAEFDCWRWVDYWYPLTTVVSFKKDIYSQVLEEFDPLVKSLSKNEK